MCTFHVLLATADHISGSDQLFVCGDPENIHHRARCSESACAVLTHDHDSSSVHYTEIEHQDANYGFLLKYLGLFAVIPTAKEAQAGHQLNKCSRWLLLD